MIDNYDSFTYNLVDYIASAGVPGPGETTTCVGDQSSA